MSDRGIPATFRHMHGFGSHTYSFINATAGALLGEVPFPHPAGHQEPDRRRSGSADRPRSRKPSSRPVRERSNAASFRAGRCSCRSCRRQDAATYKVNPFDLTKVWSQRDYPLIEVGVMELNRNAENYFADVEQAAFSPSNVVPGISFSPDKMLQGRLFSYGDAQRYRLGVNYHQIPVNAPRGAKPVPQLSPRRADAGRRQHGRRRRPTSRIRAANGRSSRTSASRRCRSTARPITGTIASTTTTTRSRAICSA